MGPPVSLARTVVNPTGPVGHASHGWTDEQAAGFAERCHEMGFVAVQVGQHSGRRPLLTVQAHAA